MQSPLNYTEINQQLWNKKTDYHIASSFYDVEGFLRGRNSLNEIELSLLGDVRGKKILHLQCHFGQDTLSLARMGAQVTGVDISDRAIAAAEQLAQKMNLEARFVCCNIYELPQHLMNEQFDIVFTSYGVIGWLPNLEQWATVVANYVAPSGRFIMAEFHPVVWMFDNDFENITYAYHNETAIIETIKGTYADQNAPLQADCITWNHSLSEIMNPLINNNLSIINFSEYDYSPYDCFKEGVMESFAEGKFRVKHLGNKIPMVFSIVATKNQ